MCILARSVGIQTRFKIPQEGFVTGDEGDHAAPFSDADNDNEFKVRHQCGHALKCAGSACCPSVLWCELVCVRACVRVCCVDVRAHTSSFCGFAFIFCCGCRGVSVFLALPMGQSLLLLLFCVHSLSAWRILWHKIIFPHVLFMAQKKKSPHPRTHYLWRNHEQKNFPARIIYATKKKKKNPACPHALFMAQPWTKQFSRTY